MATLRLPKPLQAAVDAGIAANASVPKVESKHVIDMKMNYLGLELEHPLIVGASPALTRSTASAVPRGSTAISATGGCVWKDVPMAHG